MDYNIIGELKKNIQDFGEKITITRQRPEDIRYVSKESRYSYSQSDTISSIDMAILSQFEEGKLDSEGKRKRYFNKVRFVRDVSRMRTDIDTKHFVFTPESYEDTALSYVEQKQFRVWARENYYGEELNRLQDDYNTYGTAVQKKIGKKTVRVPLKNLINTQTADTLKDAVLSGGYVIEVHKKTLPQIEKMKGWDSTDFEYGKEYTIYERYSLVPRYIVEKKKITGRPTKEDLQRVLAMQVLTTDVVDVSTGEGKILFIEEIPENRFPYEDVFWEKVDGRWLGYGPVEGQLEAQGALNLNANLRRRALIKATRHIYQTSSKDVAKNLNKELKDGDVLYVGLQGGINPIATETRNIAELGADKNTWDENSQQLSFSFEAATGEAMPSGTPFRLGAVLSAAVDSFFSLKREKFGLFLKRCSFNLIVPIFESEVGDHVVRLSQTDAGAEVLRELMIQKKASKQKADALLSMQIPDVEAIDSGVRQAISSSNGLFIEVAKDAYKDVKNRIDIDPTGEAADESQKETLINLYTILAQKGDPRADKILNFFLAKTGMYLGDVAGKAQEQSLSPQPSAQGNIVDQAQKLIQQPVGATDIPQM